MNNTVFDLHKHYIFIEYIHVLQAVRMFHW